MTVRAYQQRDPPQQAAEQMHEAEGFRGEVVVQFWLKSGELAVTQGPGEEQREERIPGQLRRLL